MTTKLGHVGYTVRDLDRSIAFYEIFGFELFFRVERSAPWLADTVGYDGAKIEFAHMRLPSGMHLELLEYKNPTGQLDLPDDTWRVGNSHFCLWVEDIKATHARLVAFLRSEHAQIGKARIVAKVDEAKGGVELTEGPQAGGIGFYMRDPDGHTIEIWQPAKSGQGFGQDSGPSPALSKAAELLGPMAAHAGIEQGF